MYQMLEEVIQHGGQAVDHDVVHEDIWDVWRQHAQHRYRLVAHDVVETGCNERIITKS